MTAGLVLGAMTLLAAFAALNGCTSATPKKTPTPAPVFRPTGDGNYPPRGIPAKHRRKTLDLDIKDSEVMGVPWATYVDDDGNPIDLEPHVWIEETCPACGRTYTKLIVVKPDGLLFYRWHDERETRRQQIGRGLLDDPFGPEHRDPPFD